MKKSKLFGDTPHLPPHCEWGSQETLIGICALYTYSASLYEATNPCETDHLGKIRATCYSNILAPFGPYMCKSDNPPHLRIHCTSTPYTHVTSSYSQSPCAYVSHTHTRPPPAFHRPYTHGGTTVIQQWPHHNPGRASAGCTASRGSAASNVRSGT